MSKSFLTGLRRYFSGADIVQPAPQQRLALSDKNLDISLQSLPIAIEAGRQQLHIYPDLALSRDDDEDFSAVVLYDPERVNAGISSVMRLAEGQTLELTSCAIEQPYLFDRPQDIIKSHLQISYQNDALAIKKASAQAAYVTVLEHGNAESPLLARRLKALYRLAEIYGGALEPLPPRRALAVLNAVNEILEQDAYRSKDIDNRPGALVELPADITPIIIGDLHAQVDNLLKIISENAFMESLEEGKAALIFLGDAVHPEDPRYMAYMDTSVLMMDVIFRLKLHFPSQVFFLIGNHDSFVPEVTKGGVPQNLLWYRRLIELRGADYAKAMALFYERSPLFVLAKNFIACHAGAPRIEVSPTMLVNARHYPQLAHELIWNRLKRPGFPEGYDKSDVQRLRTNLGVAEDLPFIVGHSPLSRRETIWLNVAQIEDHHIVYSAQPDQVGLFTQINDIMVPQAYPAEPLREWLNEQLAATA